MHDEPESDGSPTQDDEIEHLPPSKQLIVMQSNSTRWNSTYNSVLRALAVHNKLDHYCFRASQKRQDPLDKADLLTPDDWLVLSRITEALHPLNAVTLQLQGKNKEGHHGNVWEVLPTMETLLSHFENIRNQYLERQTYVNGRQESLPDDEEHIGTAGNLAWKKLDKYYNLTDYSFVYVTAVVLKPNCRFRLIEKKWRSKPDWVATARLSLFKAWGEWVTKGVKPFVNDIRDLAADEEPPSKRLKNNNLFEDWMADGADAYSETNPHGPYDELEAYLALPNKEPKPYSEGDNLFKW